MAEKILILDFGSQYTQLIARRVRELNVYCEIHPYNHVTHDISDFKGENPETDIKNIDGLPVLGICYGAQLMAHDEGGYVLPSEIREYGRALLSEIDQHNSLLKEVTINSQVWMSHGDTISSLPDNFEIIASPENVEVAADKVKGKEK